jgi:adenylyltransferase/sulfurtransferase
LNSEVELIAIEEALTKDNAEQLFSQYDLILDGTDNFETKYLINDACILAGKPWVYASIYKNEGQLSVFNYKNGPSYRCLFPKTTRQNVSCEATGVLGVVPGIFGMLQAMEALKIILGVGKELSGKLKISNLLSGSEQILNFQQRPEEIEKVKKIGIMPVRIDCEMIDSDKKYLDVREAFEQPKVTAANVIHIPLGELGQRSNEIPKQEEVLVFCQSGKRSQQAVAMLQTDFGFQNLKNVKGGIKTIING